jgi:hypothetical protein
MINCGIQVETLDAAVVDYVNHKIIIFQVQLTRLVHWARSPLPMESVAKPWGDEAEAAEKNIARSENSLCPKTGPRKVKQIFIISKKNGI